MREQEINNRIKKLEQKLSQNGEEIEDLFEEVNELERQRGVIIESMTARNHSENMSRLRTIGIDIRSNEEKSARRKITRKNILEDIENTNKWEVTK